MVEVFVFVNGPKGQWRAGGDFKPEELADPQRFAETYMTAAAVQAVQCYNELPEPQDG